MLQHGGRGWKKGGQAQESLIKVAIGAVFSVGCHCFYGFQKWDLNDISDKIVISVASLL